MPVAVLLAGHKLDNCGVEYFGLQFSHHHDQPASKNVVHSSVGSLQNSSHIVLVHQSCLNSNEDAVQPEEPPSGQLHRNIKIDFTWDSWDTLFISKSPPPGCCSLVQFNSFLDNVVLVTRCITPAKSLLRICTLSSSKEMRTEL